MSPGYGEPELEPMGAVAVDELAENGHVPAVPANVLEALRAQRERHAGDRFYDVPVTGYGGRLVVRLRPLPPATLTKLRERMERSRSDEREFYLTADTFIAATREVLVRARPSDELQPLDPDDPVRIDDRLAAVLELPAGTAREVLVSLYGLANSPEWAIIDAMSDYLSWASSAVGELDEALEGES